MLNNAHTNGLTPLPKDSHYYDWEEPADHSWLAVDEANHVGLFTCAMQQGLPVHIKIPSDLLLNLDDRVLEVLPEFTVMDTATEVAMQNWGRDLYPSYTAFVRKLASRGLFYFRYPDIEKPSLLFERFVVPQKPLIADQLPAKLLELARYFTVRNRRFDCAEIKSEDFRRLNFQ